MQTVALPEEDAGELFAACATRTRSVADRTALLLQRPHVEARAASYLEHANRAALHEFAIEVPVGIPAAELSGVYDRVLVKGGERSTYVKLKGAARYGRCPLCAQRDVKTLDHYLTREDYPELAVVPANLVPCCSDCNHAKGTYRTTRGERLLFHPYFDDWSAHRLIKATLIFDEGLTVTYSVREAHGASETTLERARRHFYQLDLGNLYSKHAAVELVDRKVAFLETFQADGPEGLRNDLKIEVRSRRRRNINSWQSALYRALSRSDEFCAGGFQQIEDP